MTALHLNGFQVINSCFSPPHWAIMHIIRRCTYFIDVHIGHLNTTSFGHKRSEKLNNICRPYARAELGVDLRDRMHIV